MKDTSIVRLSLSIVVISAVLLFATCGSGFQVVLNANLEPTSLKLNVGEKGEFTPVVNAIGGYSVTWESSKPSVASVDDDGLVAAHTVGETEITATFTDSITVTVPVEVVDPDAPDPEPDPGTNPDLAINLGSILKMAKGDSRVISTSGESSVTWSSGNEDVAVVREASASDGVTTYKLYGVGPGRTTITATSNEDPDIKTEIEVTVVVGPTGIAIRQGHSLEVHSGARVTLTVRATAPDFDGEFYDDSIVWESSNPSAVSVDEESGELQQITSGVTATITASAKYSHEVEDTIEVLFLPGASGVRFVDGNRINNIPAGDTLMLAVEVTGDSSDTNHHREVKWTSSDESVLRVVDTLYPEGEERVDYGGGVNSVIKYHNYVVGVVLLESDGEAELTATSATGGSATIVIGVSGDAENDTPPPDSVVINGVIFDKINSLQWVSIDGERYDQSVSVSGDKYVGEVALEDVGSITVYGVSSISDNGDGTTTVEGATMVTLACKPSLNSVTRKGSRSVYGSITFRMDADTILLNTRATKELRIPRPKESDEIDENALYLLDVVFPGNDIDDQEIPVGPTSYRHSVEWNSSDPTTLDVAGSKGSIARVNLKEPRKPGSVGVTATSTNSSESDTVEFLVLGSPSTIEIEQLSPLELLRGSMEQLSATVSGNPPYNEMVSWSSDDSGIVEIDSATGELSAVEPGTTTVRARSIVDSAVEAEIAITVVAPPDTITIEDGEEITLYPDETRTLSVELNGPDGFDRSLEWSSEESAVVTVDPATGELTARSPGTTRVTASSTLDPGVADSITVTVENTLSGIKIKQGKSVILHPGETSMLDVEFESTGDFDRSLNWFIEDGDVVSVDATGKLTAEAPGTTTVTVRPLHNEELSATVTVNVVGIVIEQGERLTMSINSRTYLSARAWGKDGRVPGIVWSLASGKSELGASVSADGLVTSGEKEGSVSVSAHVKGSTELYDTILIGVEELSLLSFGFRHADNSFSPGVDPDFGDFSQPISDAGDAVKIEVPLNYRSEDFSTLVPSFEVTPGAEVYVGRERQVSGKDSHDFSGPAPVIYTLKKGASVRSYSIEVTLSTFYVIPDINFRAWLKDTLPDAFHGELLNTADTSVRTTTEMWVEDREIVSLIGIEFFPELEWLRCHSNSLTSLDVSRNPALKKLLCGSNSLTSLDVSNNPALVLLSCVANGINSLDVSMNPKLESLHCTSTNLKTLDLSKNPALKELWCGSNSLNSLDVSKNPKLERLYCPSANLKALDVKNNPALKELACGSNSLNSLDVSKNPALKRLDCMFNNLTTLDVSQNPNLDWLRCHRNLITTLNLSGMSGTPKALRIDSGEINGKTTFNPLTTLIVHEDLRNHDEIKEAIRKRGSSFSVTYVK